MTGYLGDPSGGQSFRDRISGRVSEPEALGRELADAILGSGGDELLADLLDAEAPRPAPP